MLLRRSLLCGGLTAMAAALIRSPAAAQLQPFNPPPEYNPPQPKAFAPILHPTPRTRRPMKIGVIGAGRVGATIGELWLRAGHDVMFADRDPEVLKALAQRLPRAKIGSNVQAARFGRVVLLSVPYIALPDIHRELGAIWRGKIVIDTGNPIPNRDGEMGREALLKGSGVTTAKYLPSVRIARAFNAVSVVHMGSEAHRPGEKVAIPLAADDAAAMAMAVRLVRDAGFDPVPVGGLITASRFERNSPVMGPHTAVKLRSMLGMN